MVRKNYYIYYYNILLYIPAAVMCLGLLIYLLLLLLCTRRVGSPIVMLSSREADLTLYTPSWEQLDSRWVVV